MGRECEGMESYFKSKSKRNQIKGRSYKNKNGKLSTVCRDMSVRPCSFSL